MAEKKGFEDVRAAKKQKQLNKRLNKSRKMTAEALKKHRLGWRTRDGKEF